MKIYIVMSTHANESEYTVEQTAFRYLEKAQVEMAALEDRLYAEEFSGLDDFHAYEDMESGWDVWIEELELQDE